MISRVWLAYKMFYHVQKLLYLSVQLLNIKEYNKEIWSN